MTVDDACRKILGKKAADAIIAEQGLHWAVVAAMAGATTAHDAEAIKTIRDHISDQTAAAEHAPKASDFL